jgi:hypothetical protein
LLDKEDVTRIRHFNSLDEEALKQALEMKIQIECVQIKITDYEKL